jgi:hypothetical protein
MPVYEMRATLFLDLLGFRSLIKARREKDILEVLSIPPQIEFRNKPVPDFDFQVTAFSDCIVCSARILGRNNFLPAAYIAIYAGRLALEMLARGILVRGAITVGKLYHQGQTVFGPALIEAYELESRVAQYPRIIVPHKVYGRINMSLCVALGVEWFIENEPCRQDFDGIYHLDIFGPFYIHNRPAALRLKTAPLLKHLGPITTRVVRKLCGKQYKDPQISTKYEWLRTYLADCCTRFEWEANRPRNRRYKSLAK